MTQALLVSNVILWLLVLLLLVIVIVLARQVGLLHERIAPTGALALSKGPAVGEVAPQVPAAALDGSLQQVGAPTLHTGDTTDASGAHATLLFFLSPTCPVCKTLLPTLDRLVAEQNVRLLLASDGDELDHASFVRTHDLDPSSYFVSTELGVRYQIAKLPYAVLIDAQGIVRAQGIVNTREHLESLFEAETLGVASIQEYLKRELPIRNEEGANA